MYDVAVAAVTKKNEHSFFFSRHPQYCDSRLTSSI